MKIEKLKKLKEKGKVRPLIKALNDKDSIVRENAAKALGEIKNNDTALALKEKLNDNEDKVRIASIYALGEIGDIKTVNALINQFKYVNADINNAVLSALCRFRAEDVSVYLLKFLETGSIFVRIWCIKTLGELGDVKAVEPIIKHIDDSEILVQASALEALGKLGGEQAKQAVFERLFDEENKMRICAAQSLKMLGEPEWEQRAKGNVDDYYNIALSKDERVFEHLTNRLIISTDNDIKISALKGLKVLEDKRSIKYFILALKYDELREHAEDGLISFESFYVIKPLLDKGINDNEDRNESTARIIKDLASDDQSVIRQIIDILKDDKSKDKTRALAAYILWSLKIAEAFEPILSSLSDEYYLVRAIAVKALGALGDKRAVLPLIDMLGEHYGFMRKQAADSLKALGEAKWAEHIKGNQTDFDNIDEIKDIRIKNALIKAMECPLLYIRKSAASALINLVKEFPEEKVIDSETSSRIQQTRDASHSDHHDKSFYSCGTLMSHDDTHEDIKPGLKATDF